MASIYATGNKRWTAQVNLRGRRRSRTFGTKSEAARWARLEEAEDDRGRAPASADLTFADLTEEYLAHVAESGGGMGRSREGAIRHIVEIIGRRRLRDFDVALFRDFCRERKAEGAGPATIGQDMSYIHTVLVTAGPLLGAATETALGHYIAARRILGTSGAIGRPKERRRRPADDELRQLCEFWGRRRRAIPMWDVTLFAIASAMRLGEICRIEWADVDRTDRTVLIRDRKHPRSRKGNDERVPLLAGPARVFGETVDPLAIIDLQPRTDAAIFPFSAPTVSTSFSRAVAACGIEDLRFHDLRHDGVSRLFEAGLAIEQVSIVSGHRDWSMLRRYTHIRPGSLHARVAR